MALAGLRLKRAAQPLTDAWRHVQVAPRGATLLGVSWRTPQAAALGLDAPAALQTLLAYPFQIIRLGAYWNRIEPEPGAFEIDALDAQIAVAEQAGKRIILCVGPLKTFGYPEFFVPAHHLHPPLREGRRVTPAAYPALLEAAAACIARIVARYRARQSIVAWQLEHEAVDPLGVEHSWRLDVDFIQHELAALEQADPTRPVMMNGFLPTTLPVWLMQGWRTRDQGDALAVAQRLVDIVGIDYYPRHALLALGDKTLYLDGSAPSRPPARWQRMYDWTRAHGQRLMISEGQAEPWEAVTTPPDPAGQAMYSCLPEHVIANYTACLRWSRPDAPLYAYLFWGAEYWLLRQQHGDPSYLAAFARILAEATNG
jgi:hypothetical protein